MRLTVRTKEGLEIFAAQSGRDEPVFLMAEDIRQYLSKLPQMEEHAGPSNGAIPDMNGA